MKINIFLLILTLTFLTNDIKSKDLLLIGSYHKEFKWVQDYRLGINEIFSSTKYKLKYFDMDTKRLPKKKHSEMAEKAWKEFHRIKPSLVFLADDAALKYLGIKFSELEVPVVYFGVNNNPRKYFNHLRGDNITGILERPLLKRSIHYIKKIFPKTKNILVLFDSGLTAQVIKKETFEDKNLLKFLGMNIQLVFGEDWKDWKKIVRKSSNKYDIMIVGLFQTIRDHTGKYIPSEEVINWTSKNTPIPPFGFWDFAVGEKRTIGGMILHGKEFGKRAAKMAMKILEGTPVKEIPPKIVSDGQFIFSKTQLQKWNIKLPQEIEKRAILLP